MVKTKMVEDSDYKIIFFHGFGSDCETNKFTHITHPVKECVTVDYSQMPYDEIYALYRDMIDKSDNEDYLTILVGHSLGGYWAHRLGYDLSVAALMLNPQLFPTKEEIKDKEKYTLPGKPNESSIFYIETGDDVIDVPRTIEYADPIGRVEIYEGGHHKIEQLDEVNRLIERMINTVYLIQPCYGGD